MIDDEGNWQDAGPEKLHAHVQAESIPGLYLAAITEATRVYGPEAVLHTDSMSEINSCDGMLRACVVIICTNYDRIDPPCEIPVPDEIPREWPPDR